MAVNSKPCTGSQFPQRLRSLAWCWFLLLWLALFAVCSRAATPTPLAFPGADGFGAFTRGAFGAGKQPTILFVTTLADSGPGSLRAALEAGFPRIVIFKVGGLIQLQSSITIRSPYLTLAGQTAPGDGIAIAGHGLVVKTHDVIIRGIRVRPGDAGEIGEADNRDGISIEESYNVIVDHCSFSWAVDETVTLWNGNRNITVQNSIIAEALNWSIHSKSNPKYQKGKWSHAMGLLIGSEDGRGTAHNVSVHHNLLANNRKRLPRISGNTTVEWINNVVYNWDFRAAQLADAERFGPLRFDMIGNTYKAGPSTKWFYALDFDLWEDAQPMPGSLVYLEGNIDPHRTRPDQDEWDITTRRPGLEMYRSETRAVTPSGLSMHQNAADAYHHVLAHAGARPLDPVDSRTVNDVIQGTGRMIDSPVEVGGYPVYQSAPYPTDSSGTGIPDDWLRAHGLDPADPNVAFGDHDGDGYANIEEYINSLLEPDPLFIAWPKGTVLSGDLPVIVEENLPKPLQQVTISLDGADLYTGRELPAGLTLSSGTLSDRVHRLQVSIVDANGTQHTRMADFVVQNVRIAAPAADATLRKAVPVQLDVFTPAAEIAEVSLALYSDKAADGKTPAWRETYAGTGALVLDTTAVADGSYVLQASVRTRSGSLFTHSVPVTVQNWQVFKDELMPPHTSLFLGTIDNTLTIAESPGWHYSTDNAPSFAGDRHRKTCSTGQAEYLVWATPGIRSYRVTLFAENRDTAAAAVPEVSTDGVNWQRLTTAALEEVTGQGSSWRQFVLSGAVPVRAEYFRLLIEPQSPGGELQVGSAEYVIERQ